MLFHFAGRSHRTKCGQARASCDQGQVASKPENKPSRQSGFFILPAFSFTKQMRKAGMAACGKL
jgi:hypothetical protein